MLIAVAPAFGAFMLLEHRQRDKSQSMQPTTPNSSAPSAPKGRAAITRYVVTTVLLLAAGAVVVGSLLLAVLRDSLFTLNMDKLDDWVRSGGETSTIQSQVVEPCTMLVLGQAGAFERLQLMTLYRDELDFRTDVCVKMTANRLYKQPEFEKPETVTMICDDPDPYHELFGRLCRRSGLKLPK